MNKRRPTGGPFSIGLVSVAVVPREEPVQSADAALLESGEVGGEGTRHVLRLRHVRVRVRVRLGLALPLTLTLT